jgi:hypothetical protein
VGGAVFDHLLAECREREFTYEDVPTPPRSLVDREATGSRIHRGVGDVLHRGYLGLMVLAGTHDRHDFLAEMHTTLGLELGPEYVGSHRVAGGAVDPPAGPPGP